MGGAILINKTTKQPEWVPSDKINQALAGGGYYSKTGTVNVTSNTGAARSVQVKNLARQEEEAGVEVVSESKQYVDRVEADKRASYDNGLDKFLAFTEGAASSLTYGVADIYMDDESTRMRSDVNSGWRGFGEVAGIVGPALVTGGAAAAPHLAVAGVKGAAKVVSKGLLKSTVREVLRHTPAGFGARLATKAGVKAGSKFAEGSLARKGTALAVEGAVEAAMWSTGQQLSQAIIEDKDLAAESMLSQLGSDVLFGAAVGGGFAAVGHGLSAIKSKIDTRSMKKANPLFDLDSEVSKGFRGAIVGSADDAMKYDKYFKEKLGALDVLEHRGFSDKAAFGLRKEAYGNYNVAKAKYKRFLGFKDELVSSEQQEVALKRFMMQSSKRDILKFVKVLDDLHVRTSELDSLLKPSGPGADLAKFRKDTDVTAFDPKPMTRTQTVGESQSIDSVAPLGGTVNVRGGRAKPKLGEGPALAAFDAEDKIDLFGVDYRNAANKLSNDIMAQNAAISNKALPGFGSKRFDERMFELGKGLKDETGAKIGVLDTLAVAEALGVDMDKIPIVGPVASSVLNLWLFYRLGGALAERGGRGGRGRGGIGGFARNAMANGIARMGAGYGRGKGGDFGAGVGYAAAYGGAQAAMRGVSKIGAGTGEVSSKIKDAVKYVLTPNVKQAIKRVIVPINIANVSYAAPLDTDPKDDYGRIEAQLSRSATDDLAMQTYLNTQFEDFRILDPGLTDAMVSQKQKQLKYLYSKLPQRPISMPMGMPWAPPPSDMLVFKQTAAIYQDPMMVVTRMQMGTLTKGAVDDLAAMWPTIHGQLVDALMDGALGGDGGFEKLNSSQKKMISLLTGQPLVPEVDPHLVSFTQEGYMKDRKQTESQGNAIAGANSVKAGTATPGQQYGMGPKR